MIVHMNNSDIEKIEFIMTADSHKFLSHVKLEAVLPKLLV